MSKTTKAPAVTIEGLQRELREVRREMEERIAFLEKRLGASASTAAPAPQPELPEEITPATIAVLAAAITTYLGKKVRVRSARRIYPGGNPWAQQGRAFVQASHNLTR